mgnify:FL=1|tara:strand:+ start:192 stop:467 length:276 start_codon:yes stop_codon:yes gene_type:complete
MNYEKHFMALCIPGESGNGIIVIEYGAKQVECLKIFAGGNTNLTIPKDLFDAMVLEETLEIIEEMPDDVYADVRLTWENNDKKVESTPSMD